MAYSFTLDKFKGPLDLLVHLIEKAEMDIKDIKISEITTQYLAYMEMIDDLDMDAASDFLSIAATLLFIKSRSLLPVVKKQSDDELEDPEQALIRQIQEYKLFKEASEELNLINLEAANVFVRMPDEALLPPPKMTIVGLDIQNLVDAFASAIRKTTLVRSSEEEKREVRLDQYKISERIEYIKSRIKKGKSIKFSTLTSGNSKMQLIVTFMALLELLCTGEIEAVQSNNFEEIIIRGR